MGFFSSVFDASTDPIGHLTGSTKAAKAAKKAGAAAEKGYLEAGEIGYDAYTQGSDEARQGDIRARDYLMQQNEVDRAGSSNAQRRLMGLYGLDGGTGSQQTLINQAQESPLYAAITGTREAGEDAIMRNAAATGGLRAGNVQSNMYDYNQRLDERALLESYDQQLSGLEGIAGWQTNENNIAEAIRQPFTTRATGITAGGLERANATSQGAQARANAITGAGQAEATGRGQAMQTAGTIAAAYWSDPRLKDNVRLLASVNGHNIYEWTWNALAESLGLSGYDTGVMASEIEQTHPEAVGESQGYQTVNYDMLGV